MPLPWRGTSLPAQPRDEGACPRELSFIIGRSWRIAAIAHRFKRRIDLAECGLSHGCVPPPLGEEHQRNAFIPKTHGPIERHALAGPFLQRLAIGDDCLFELCRPALASPQRLKHVAQIVLGHGPLERHALARPFLQRLAIGDDRIFELRRPALAPSEAPKRKAQSDFNAMPRLFCVMAQ